MNIRIHIFIVLKKAYFFFKTFFISVDFGLKSDTIY